MKKVRKNLKKQKTLTHFAIEDPVLKFKLNFLFGSTEKDFLDFVNQFNQEEVPLSGLGNANGMVVYDAKNDYNYLWLKTKDVNVLAHETLHLVFQIFNHKGIEYSSEGEEFFAYYYEWWFREIRKKLKEV